MTEKEKAEMVAYRIERAKETLEEVWLHVENELWTTAVNRLYYACFYAVSGLLLKNDIKVSTHTGVRQMLGLHFIKTEKIIPELGKFYSRIFDMRHTGDYDDFVEFNREEVTEMIKPATNLIIRIEELIL